MSTKTAPQVPLEVRDGGAAPAEKGNRPWGMMVEELEDKGEDSVVYAADLLFKYPKVPKHNEGIHINAKGGNPAGEMATLSLPALGAQDLQTLQFLMPKDLPHLNEKVVWDGSPSVYLQRQCLICFSGSKPELKTSVYIPGILDFASPNSYVHQCSGYRVYRCQLCTVTVPFMML